MKKILFIAIIAIAAGGVVYAFNNSGEVENKVNEAKETIVDSIIPEQLHPLMIDSLRNRTYDSDITIVQDLGDQGAFRSYIISYMSDGLKLRALMNVPESNKPANGFPVLFLNHGYIPPDQYSVTSSYKAFADYYSRNGFLVLKPDYRGHDDSEGDAANAHLSHDYVIDVLNLLSAIKKYPDADPANIGMWGHSNGGRITLLSIVVSSDIKASMLVAGVVASPQTFIEYGLNRPETAGYIRENAPLLKTIAKSDALMSRISPYTYLDSIAGPVSIHHGTADTSVPVGFSHELRDALLDAGKGVEYYEYQGADHNLAGSARNTFLQRSLVFFNTNLK